MLIVCLCALECVLQCALFAFGFAVVVFPMCLFLFVCFRGMYLLFECVWRCVSHVLMLCLFVLFVLCFGFVFNVFGLCVRDVSFVRLI